MQNITQKRKRLLLAMPIAGAVLAAPMIVRAQSKTYWPKGLNQETQKPPKN
jgi:hypothetical protein